MGCADCINTMAEMQEQLSIVRKQAKEFAINNRVNAFVYNEEGTLRFISEEAARKQGIQPTHGVVSYLQPVTA